MIWINLEQISSNPLSFRSPNKVYQYISFFHSPTKNHPKTEILAIHFPEPHHTKPQNRLNRNETAARTCSFKRAKSSTTTSKGFLFLWAKRCRTSGVFWLQRATSFLVFFFFGGFGEGSYVPRNKDQRSQQTGGFNLPFYAAKRSDVEQTPSKRDMIHGKPWRNRWKMVGIWTQKRDVSGMEFSSSWLDGILGATKQGHLWNALDGIRKLDLVGGFNPFEKY